MADVKIDRSEQKGLDRERGGGIARRGAWWPGPSEFFTMNPFSLMRRLSEEMDRAFNSSFGLGREPGEPGWMPAIEVRERHGNLEICADLPGLKKDDLKVQVTGDGVIIEGERKHEEEESKGGMHRSERSYGRFYRMIPLPEGADVDKARAEFKDGVLSVKVPVPESKSKPRDIPIST